MAIHVLVCPRREVKRFLELTVDETSDLWLTAKRIGAELERFHKASSLTFTLQVRFIVKHIFSLLELDSVFFT